MRPTIILASALLIAGCSAPGDPEPLVTVNDARVTALPTSAAVYFTLANSGGRDRLLSVDAAGVGKASLHETSMNGDMMRMRMIDGGIEVPADGQVRLAANGKHVMIEGLATPIEPGSSIRLTLRFERQGEVMITAPVSGPR